MIQLCGKGLVTEDQAEGRGVPEDIAASSAEILVRIIDVERVVCSAVEIQVGNP